MSYRKITVAQVQYEYVIGSTTHAYLKMIVTPAIVADIIAGKAIRPMSSCHHGTVTSKMTGNPYSSEVYGVDDNMIDCKKRVNEGAMDI